VRKMSYHVKWVRKEVDQTVSQKSQPTLWSVLGNVKKNPGPKRRFGADISPAEPKKRGELNPRRIGPEKANRRGNGPVGKRFTVGHEVGKKGVW